MKPVILFIIGVLFWLGETWYFDWNTTPSCQAEKICDFIAWVIVFTSMIRMFINEIAKEVIKSLDKSGRVKQLETALNNMRFAYINKDGEMPHQFETDALAETEELIGRFGESCSVFPVNSAAKEI
jgi:hypothetical protein